MTEITARQREKLNDCVRRAILRGLRERSASAAAIRERVRENRESRD